MKRIAKKKELILMTQPVEEVGTITIKAVGDFGKVHYLTPKVRWIPEDGNSTITVKANLREFVRPEIYEIIEGKKEVKE